MPRTGPKVTRSLDPKLIEQLLEGYEPTHVTRYATGKTVVVYQRPFTSTPPGSDSPLPEPPSSSISKPRG